MTVPRIQQMHTFMSQPIYHTVAGLRGSGVRFVQDDRYDEISFYTQACPRHNLAPQPYYSLQAHVHLICENAFKRLNPLPRGLYSGPQEKTTLSRRNIDVSKLRRVLRATGATTTTLQVDDYNHTWQPGLPSLPRRE